MSDSMTRRDFLKASAGAAGGVSLAALAASSARGDDRGGAVPNIVFIFADDMGYSDVDCYDSQDRYHISTPRIDAMAQDGMKFTSFYVAQSVCTPSRAGLLTGRYPKRFGCDVIYFPDSTKGIPASEITLAEALKGLGYTTGIFGKWHLGVGKAGLHHGREQADLTAHHEFMPTEHGFDEFFGIPYSNSAGQEDHPDKGDWPYMMLIRNLRIVEQGDASMQINQRWFTRRFTVEAIKFMRKAVAQNKPFFAYLAHPMPHVPLYVSRYFDGKSAEHARLAEHGLYADVIEEIDWSVGKVLDELKRLGIDENTIVVFTSDNGPWLLKYPDCGSAREFSNRTTLRSEAGDKKAKGTCFEGGLRVPLVVRWPGQIAPGSVNDEPACAFDWFPTFVNLAGGALATDRDYDGRDITGVLKGTGSRNSESDPFKFFYYRWQYSRNENQRRSLLMAYRKGNYKIMPAWSGRGMGGRSWNLPDQLYDLSTENGRKELWNDPSSNLLKTSDPAHRATYDALKAEYDDWRTNVIPE